MLTKRSRWGDSETYYHDRIFQTSVAEPQTLEYELFNPNQGAGEGERLGDYCTIEDIVVRILLNYTPQHYRSLERPNLFARAILYVDRAPYQPMDDPPLIRFDTAQGFMQFEHPMYQDRVTILSDQVIKLTPGEAIPTSIGDSELMYEDPLLQHASVTQSIAIPQTELQWQGELKKSSVDFLGGFREDQATLSSSSQVSVQKAAAQWPIQGTALIEGAVVVAGGEGGPLTADWKAQGSDVQLSQPQLTLEGTSTIQSGNIGAHNILVHPDQPLTMGEATIESGDDPQLFVRAAHNLQLTGQQWSTWSGNSEFVQIHIEEPILWQAVPGTSQSQMNAVKLILYPEFTPQPVYTVPDSNYDCVQIKVVTRSSFKDTK